LPVCGIDVTGSFFYFFFFFYYRFFFVFCEKIIRLPSSHPDIPCVSCFPHMGPQQLPSLVLPFPSSQESSHVLCPSYFSRTIARTLHPLFRPHGPIVSSPLLLGDLLGMGTIFSSAAGGASKPFTELLPDLGNPS